MPHLISPNRSHRPYKSYSIPPPISLEVKLPEENPTIGLLLCKSAKKTVVELTLLNVRQHHVKEPERSGDRLPQAARRASAASQYQLYLPSKELLKQKLDEWSAAASR
jgi:hypothetical protein